MYKKLKYPALIVISIFLMVSVALGLLFGWYCSLVPLALLFITEMGLREARSMSEAEVLPTEEQAPPSPILPQITISQWLVTDMIQATCNDDYSSCGSREHYEYLMYQFTDSSGGEDIATYKDLTKEKTAIEIDAISVMENVGILKVFWCEAAAARLRGFGLREFTKETYISDCKWMEAYLINERRKVESISESLSKLFTGSDTKPTAEQYTQNIEDMLSEMAVMHPGTVYVLEGMKASKLASLKRARNRHIKNIEEQIMRSKSGGKA